MPDLMSRRRFGAVVGGVVLATPVLAAPGDAITDKLENWSKYPELKQYSAAFDYLRKTDFRRQQPGRVDLDGNRVYATLSESKARLAESAKFEAHRLYTDIHYLVEGRETIGSVPLSGLKLTDPYKDANDIEFYQPPAKYRKIELTPGQFAVFPPGYGHMPGLGVDTSALIRKVVVKIRVK